MHRRLLRVFGPLGGMAVLLASLPAPAQELTPQDLKALEQATAADAAAQKQQPPPPAAATPAPSQGAFFSLNPDISVILDVALAVFNHDENLQQGGHDPSKNGFNLQQLELSFSHIVDPYFRFDSNLVFGPDGFELEEAYATTLALPASLQIRAGQFLTKFGRLNATHPHTWDFVDQPFALSRIFGGDGNRGLGLEISWLAPLPWFVELDFSATQAEGEATARSFYGANDLGVHGPFDFQHTAALKQFFALSDDWSLFTGLSFADGPNGDDLRTEIYGADLYLKYRPISYGSYTIVALQSEVFFRRRHIPDDVVEDVDLYAYLTWRFAQRWATGARYELGSAPFRGLVDSLDPEWTGARHRVTADVTFWPTEFSRIRLQGSIDAPAWIDTPTYAAFLALEVAVGAHGAHKF